VHTVLRMRALRVNIGSYPGCRIRLFLGLGPLVGRAAVGAMRAPATWLTLRSRSLPQSAWHSLRKLCLPRQSSGLLRDYGNADNLAKGSVSGVTVFSLGVFIVLMSFCSHHIDPSSRSRSQPNFDCFWTNETRPASPERGSYRRHGRPRGLGSLGGGAGHREVLVIHDVSVLSTKSSLRIVVSPSPSGNLRPLAGVSSS
jgi:hypothetical protein